jgi:hypothetical protein
MAAGKLVGLVDILLDFQTGLCNTGGVSEGKIFLALAGDGADDFNFALPLGMLF